MDRSGYVSAKVPVMQDSSYPRFCPVAMAASLLEPRWTMLVLCEMWSGSTRFNEIQRGVPGMSPGLLSKRLKRWRQTALSPVGAMVMAGTWNI